MLDKYDLYTKAVQDPSGHCDFLNDVYRRLLRRSPKMLREDFCGTFALAEEWIRRGDERCALAVDKSQAPLNYGRRRFRAAAPQVQSRLRIVRRDVLKVSAPKADVICALNFSYGVFKTRRDLKTYLKSCLRNLGKEGIVVLDCLGGFELRGLSESREQFDGFTYFWEQVRYNPLTREAVFHIHFQLDGGKKVRNVFTYNWRMWTVVELRELMEEVGFRSTHVYWQGSARSPEDFEPGASWVAYVVGRKGPQPC